jgi:hypothetical protein
MLGLWLHFINKHNFLLRVKFLNSTVSYVAAGDNNYSTKARQAGHANEQPIYHLLSMLEALGPLVGQKAPSVDF